MPDSSRKGAEVAATVRSAIPEAHSLPCPQARPQAREAGPGGPGHQDGRARLVPRSWPPGRAGGGNDRCAYCVFSALFAMMSTALMLTLQGGNSFGAKKLSVRFDQ